MTFIEKISRFLNPEREVKNFITVIKKQDDEIKNQNIKIRSLLVEFREEAKWRNQYTSALSLLTESMQSMVWQKDLEHKYILANPTHCERFFGFEGTPECLQTIIGKTDEYLIQNMFLKKGVENTFGSICAITDKFVIENKKASHFFEKGIVEGIEVLLYIVKIPQFEDGEIIGTMGIGWDFSEKREQMLQILERWKEKDEITIIHENNKSFCYLIEPEYKRCELFHHICPWAVTESSNYLCGMDK